MSPQSVAPLLYDIYKNNFNVISFKNIYEDRFRGVSTEGEGELGSNWACHRGQGISSCFLTQDEAQCENWEIHPKLTDKRISMLLHKFMHYVSLPSSAHETQMYDQEYDLHLPSLVLGLFIINEFCNWVVLHDVIQLTRHKQRYRTHWGLGFRGIWSSTCQIWYNVIGWCVFVFNLIYYF